MIEKLSKRCGTLLRHEVDAAGVANLELEIPSRGLIGYRSEFLTDTRGEGHPVPRLCPLRRLCRRE